MRVFYLVLVFLFAIAMAQEINVVETAETQASRPVTPTNPAPAVSSPAKPIVSTPAKPTTPKGKIVIFQSVTNNRAGKKAPKRTTKKSTKSSKRSLLKKTKASLQQIISKLRKSQVKKGRKVPVPPKRVKKHIHAAAKSINKLPVSKRRVYRQKLSEGIPPVFVPYAKIAVKAAKRVAKKVAPSKKNLDKELNTDASKLKNLEKLLQTKRATKKTATKRSTTKTRSAKVTKSASKTANVSLDGAINSDRSKLSKLEKLLRPKTKSSKKSSQQTKRASVKQVSSKRVSSKKTSSKRVTKSANKSTTTKTTKSSSKPASNSSSKKTVQRKAARNNNSAELRNIFNSVFNPEEVVVPKEKKQKKQVTGKQAVNLVFKNLATNGNLRVGRKSGCGKVRVRFNGNTSLKINNLRIQ